MIFALAVRNKDLHDPHQELGKLQTVESRNLNTPSDCIVLPHARFGLLPAMWDPLTHSTR